MRQYLVRLWRMLFNAPAMPRKHHKRELEELLEEAICLLKKLVDRQSALSAHGRMDMKTVQVGQKATFTFTEFDTPGGTGNIVPPSGRITLQSDNPAVATIDEAGQTVNNDGSVSAVVTAVGAGTANITGVDPASANKVAGGDVLTVTAVQAIAVSATGVLS